MKVGACFAPLQHEPYPYIEKWNAVLARETWPDAIVFHDYYYGQGLVAAPGATMSVEAVLHPDKFFDESIEALKKQAPGKPIWFTEWNLDQKYIQTWKNKGAELLFVAAGVCRTIHHRDVFEISLFHQLYDKVFGALYLYEKTQTIETNANYELFKLFGAAFAHADQLRPVTFASDDLLGFATQAADGIRLFAINRGATAREFQLPPECSGDLSRVTLECPPETVLKDAASFTKQQPIAGRTVTLPAYSINLLASPAALIPPAAAASAANLFPARPHLTLWYEPYAAQQPPVASDGSYALDLSALKDKPMAVVKMDLSGLNLKPGANCSLSFDARAEGGGSLTVNLPEAGTTDPSRKNRSEWMQIGDAVRPVRIVFHRDPGVNGGEVSFFFDKEQLAKGGKVVLRNFRLVTLE